MPVCLIVFTQSGRTQLALLIGIVGFFFLQGYGDDVVNNLEFSGYLQPLEEVFRRKILKHYDKAAWGLLITCSWQAYRLYQKDKKRILRFF